MSPTATTNEEIIASKLSAIVQEETNELHLKPLPKADQVAGEPDLIAVGEPSLEKPRQKVKEYKIAIEYYFDKPPVDGDWKLVEGGSGNLYTTEISVPARRLTASKRGKFMGVFATLSQKLGLIQFDQQFIAKFNFDGSDVVAMMREIDTINDLASIVLGINRDYLEYANPYSSMEWFMDFLANEENYIADAVNFLSRGARENKA